MEIRKVKSWGLMANKQFLPGMKMSKNWVHLDGSVC